MLNRRSLLFLALALLFGLGAALTARSYIAEHSAAPVATAPDLTPVVTAARNVAAGHALNPEDLTTAEWPRDLRPEGVISDPDRLVGRVISRAFMKGEPLMLSGLLPEGAAAGLPALISPEHRAVSVKVNDVIGVAGFVQPGARVDVLATFRNTREGNFSNVILQDVRVLAVDQKMDDTRDGKPRVVSVATLEVDPVEAERLIHAAHEGKLQLALRGPGDDAIVSTRSILARDLMGKREKKPARAAARPGPTVQVIKGTTVSNESYAK